MIVQRLLRFESLWQIANVLAGFGHDMLSAMCATNTSLVHGLRPG